MDGSLSLHRRLAGIAMTIHQFGQADNWRRGSVSYDHVEFGAEHPVVETRMNVLPLAEGDIQSFDAVCGDDECYVDAVYFNG